MKKILIPVDSSDFSLKAIEEGKKMAQAFGSDVVLFYVVGIRIAAQRFSTEVSPSPTEDPFANYEKANAGEMLKKYKEAFGDMQDRVETIVVHGFVEDEIIKKINGSDVDFVIMGSKGIGSTLHRTILGSVTNKVIHNSEKPILVVR